MGTIGVDKEKGHIVPNFGTLSSYENKTRNFPFHIFHSRSEFEVPALRRHGRFIHSFILSDVFILILDPMKTMGCPEIQICFFYFIFLPAIIAVLRLFLSFSSHLKFPEQDESVKQIKRIKILVASCAVSPF